MAPTRIEVDADQLDALCRRYGVAGLFLFGSVARSDDRPGSDLDLLYDTAPALASAGSSTTPPTSSVETSTGGSRLCVAARSEVEG